MIAVVDYGVGNLYSLTCSLRHIGAQCTVTREENALRAADRIILPGVGAFGDAAEKLHALRLDALLRDLAGQGKPLMGICLGMQLLFDKSYEYGEHAGLGLIPGEVRPLAPVLAPGAKVPHMGWNSLHLNRPDDPCSPACAREISCTTCIRSTQPAAERRSPQAPITAESPSQAPSGAAACAARSFTQKRAAR